MRQIILARNSSPAVSLYLRHINGANSNVPERGIQWAVGTTRGSDLGRRLAPFFVRHNDHATVSRMARTFLYRCPNTGQNVQGWSADEVADDDDTYESFQSVACTRLHLVNLKTRKVLGEREE
jgi:hypothetical protein